MTFGDGKRKVLMLLDEYSSGGEITQDIDINNKMADFFDMAQKDMAQFQPIIAKTEITLDADDRFTDLPAGFLRYYRVWKDGVIWKKYPVIDGQMYTKGESGTIVLEYVKQPETINSNTLDTYEFEVNEAAANCLPFYVAAQQLITDLVVDYSALWNMYLTHRAALPDCLPSTGTGRVRQALFGG